MHVKKMTNVCKGRSVQYRTYFWHLMVPVDAVHFHVRV